MEAQHKLAGWVVASPSEGVTAAFRMSTPDTAVALAVLEVVRVSAVAIVVGASAVVMLTWRSPRQQSAELALVEDDGGRLAAGT